MSPPEVPRRQPGAAARLQHQAFFEALQIGEGTRDWTASRAGLIVLRYVLARSDTERESGALAAEEGSVSAAVDALPADDPERAALHAILRAVAATFRSAMPPPAEPDAARAPQPAEPLGDALIAYGDVLLARSAWSLAADVYATVWDTHAAPDSRFGGGVDPRDAGIGEYIGFRARLGEALSLLDVGPSPDADRALAALVADSTANPRLRDVYARARHAQAVAAYRRHRGSR
jgi:hypothetical protein